MAYRLLEIVFIKYNIVLSTLKDYSKFFLHPMFFKTNLWNLH